MRCQLRMMLQSRVHLIVKFLIPVELCCSSRKMGIHAVLHQFGIDLALNYAASFVSFIELFFRQSATAPICLAGRLGALHLLATCSFIWLFHLTSPFLTSRSAHHRFYSFTSFSPTCGLISHPCIWHFHLTSWVHLTSSYHIPSKSSCNDFISCNNLTPPNIIDKHY